MEQNGEGNSPSELTPPNQGLSRRDFLKLGAAAAGTALGAAEARTGFLGRLLERPKTPEILDDTVTEYGFTEHVYADPSIKEKGLTHSLDHFKESVDILKQNNQKWVRFNIWDWEAGNSPQDQPTVYNWNEENLARYDEAVNYALENGLKINLVTNTPTSAGKLPPEEYTKFTASFYEKLAERYKGKIASWQIFNEPNVHSFRTYEVHPPQTPAYIKELTDNVAIANAIIKKHDPAAKTTVNLSHYIGHGKDIKQQGDWLFEPLAPHIDQLTLDLYADDNISEINRFPKYVEYFKDRYKKDVVIGELGLSTGNRFTEADQKKFISLALQALKSGLRKPAAVFLFKLTDSFTTENDPTFNSFGFLKIDRTPKKGFQEIINLAQTAEQPTKEQITP